MLLLFAELALISIIAERDTYVILAA